MGFTNKVLFSPDVTKLIKKPVNYLKQEIGTSDMRLQKAKFGKKINEILPPFDSEYYLPEKAKKKLPVRNQVS